jgi:hypothetical protein
MEATPGVFFKILHKIQLSKQTLQSEMYSDLISVNKIIGRMA